MVNQNLIEILLSGGISKRHAERRMAEFSLGVIDALREGILKPSQAYDELFNLDLYDSIVKHRLDADLRALFQCGMQLEDVAEIVPRNLEQNFKKIERLARKILTKRSSTEGRTANALAENKAS